MVDLITAEEARKIAKPAHDIALEAQKQAVADSIKQAANGGLTAMIVRVGTDYVFDVKDMLTDAGYKAEVQASKQIPQSPEVTFLTVSW